MLSTILSISDKPMTENKVTPRERARWNTSVLTYIYASYFILYLSFSIPLFFSAKSEAKAAAKAAAREEKERMKKWTQSLLSKARHSWIKSFPRHAVKLVPFEWRFRLSPQFSPETSCQATWRGPVMSNWPGNVRLARECSCGVLIG